MTDDAGQTRVKVREGAAVWREVDGETVLLDLDSSLYLGINGSGSVLWPAMIRGATLDELAGLLESRYALDHERATTDVAAFVGACRDRGLLDES